MRECLGALSGPMEALLAQAGEAGAVERLWARDHTLWQDDPTEVADRLGWLDAPAEMLDRAGAIESFAIGLAGSGFTDAVLMGMGGSSLFPQVAASTFGDGARALTLHVLDSTDPATVLRLERTLPLDTTFFMAASKSGTTVETISALAYFWDRVGRPEQFAVITDPGSALAGRGRHRGFRAVFENRPDIGGRFSALSHFGLVPAALVGVDVEELLQRALDMADACRAVEAENPGARLAAALVAGAFGGRDKLTLRFDTHAESFGAWIEQLVAESTGKDGLGVIPVDREPPRPAGAYASDRLFVVSGCAADEPPLADAGHAVIGLDSDDPYDLGGEVVRWEVATALAGHLLGVNPFDQPDVQAAKEAAVAALSAGAVDLAEDPLEPLLGSLGPGDYLAVQAFVDPGAPMAERLRAATASIGEQRGVAATFGLGPRFLHSTGQLHKGGPPTGVFVQVVGADDEDAAIPGADLTFSRLKRAQAAGDLEALRARKRRAGRVSVDALLEAPARG